LVSKAQSSFNQQIEALDDPSYWNEIKNLSTKFENLKDLALKLSLVLEVIDQDGFITEYFSGCFHQFYFKISIKENSPRAYTLLKCEFNFYLKKPLVYSPNDVTIVKNKLENLKTKLKNIISKKNVKNEAKVNHNILIGQVEGNSINLFRIQKNTTYVKPALHKLKDIKKMLDSDDYIKEFMGTKEFDMNFEFPSQQSLPSSSEIPGYGH